jgi:hypothetical protein
MLTRLKQHGLERKATSYWAWIEAMIVTVSILLVCYALNPKNPLFMHEFFPWPWMAGVILVLQYGLGPGLISAMIIICMAMTPINPYPMIDVQGYVLSGMTLLLVCVLFSTNWQRRVIHAEELLGYTNERLDSLSQSYYLLRLSYDYLEQNIITKPYTLRLALEELQKINLATQGHLTADLSHRFLQVVAQYCSINSGGIYTYDRKKLNTTPLAKIGPMEPLDLNDPLIHQSIQSQEISYVNMQQLQDTDECNYLVSAPLRSSTGHCFGYLVIKDMSFWTLNQETLTMLSILIAYFIEDLAVVKTNTDFLNDFPDCPHDFVNQFNKLLRLKKNLSVDSALCATIVPPTLRPYHVMEQLKRQRRFLDAVWVLEAPHHDVLITLMPFANATAVHGFQLRILNFLNVELGIRQDKASPLEHKITFRSMQLENQSARESITNFLSFIGMRDE